MPLRKPRKGRGLGYERVRSPNCFHLRLMSGCCLKGSSTSSRYRSMLWFFGNWLRARLNSHEAKKYSSIPPAGT